MLSHLILTTKSYNHLQSGKQCHREVKLFVQDKTVISKAIFFNPDVKFGILVLLSIIFFWYSYETYVDSFQPSLFFYPVFYIFNLCVYLWNILEYYLPVLHFINSLFCVSNLLFYASLPLLVSQTIFLICRSPFWLI